MSHQTSREPIEILLVEDNPGDVRLAQEAFRTVDVETRFHTVSDGDEALTVLQERFASEASVHVDLVLLDLNLPRVSGFEVLETIRNDPELASLPILVLTSSKASEDVARSYDLCANAYLTKPSGPDEFASLGAAVESFWMDEAMLPPAPSEAPS
ncbi:response regulator [Natrialba asiatica]|uniref:Response regulator receiver protein n=1 Tax=Natrialba asiatica (strain ATCC 700177 / DSM 12278 / JCM 9576 / FERM P-10747 / NBRC 102637 / 172P1) TaxID=29540 RepID=M0AWL3_NATA1|nr:response regulator [Natrialba asiatica]ELZ03046.1 response regulator receiver protein [Natrialba asiatica DSM 12278]